MNKTIDLRVASSFTFEAYQLYLIAYSTSLAPIFLFLICPLLGLIMKSQWKQQKAMTSIEEANFKNRQ